MDIKAVPKPPEKKKAKKTTKLPCTFAELQDQKVGKDFMPPDSRLWKSRADQTWHCRVQDLPEHSRSHRKHGPLAMRLVISLAWRDHCFLNGTAIEGCGGEGLIFGIAAPA